MEGRMPSMVEDVGADESQVGSEVELNQRQQLTEKLEKSEAGRKKLRQAIVLLKEKLEATSNALEVNETLRRELEKERLNVDTERLLREKAEKENLTIKEQFTGVLQRLDSLESSYVEVGRIRSEVKEAVGCVHAALQAVEATKGLYESLERTVHAKINGAVQSSSKALTIAQSGQAATSRAQAAALGAQSVAKAVQKEVQLLSSQVVTLQRQASKVTTLEASLPQLRSLATPDVTAAPPQAKDVSNEGNMLNMLVASPTVGLPPRGGVILSRSQIPDERLKPPQIRPESSTPKKGPVATIIGLDTILGAKGNVLEVQPQRFPNKRRVVKRGQGDPNRKQDTLSTSARNETCPTHVEADVSHGEPCPSGSTTALLKSIIKTFEREGKHRRTMEEKLMKLQAALESSSPVQAAQTGVKRKREPRKGKGKKQMSDFGVSDAVTSYNQRSCISEDKCILQEKEVQQQQQNDTATQDRLSKMISNLQGRCRGEGLFETTEITHVDDSSKEGTGTNTDDDLGEDWLAKRVLLSPISNENGVCG